MLGLGLAVYGDGIPWGIPVLVFGFLVLPPPFCSLLRSPGTLLLSAIAHIYLIRRHGYVLVFLCCCRGGVVCGFVLM